MFKILFIVDGYWTAWSNYGECGVTCGEGYKYRTRECVGKKNGGKDCVGDYKEATDCKTDIYCPIDGYWTAWSSYGECGVTCGEGYKYRTRECAGKKYGGKDCVGDYKEATDCKTDVYCPIDGYWTAWSSYGECGVTCGEGYKYRTRECAGKKYGGKDCVGDYKEATDCKTDVYCPINGYWTAWSSYGECGVTCGEGYKYRTRECVGKKYAGKDCVGDYKEATDCKTDVYCPIDGYWTAWSSYGECGVTCGEGYKYRTRECVGKKYAGKDCVGDYKEATDCKTDVYCPIDGYWTAWSNYGECGVTCGEGYKYRTRECVGKKYDGKDCVGDYKEATDCKTDVYCPVDGYWTAWSSYGECGVTCGEGYKYRTRKCVGKKYDGKDCVGDYKEATDCKTDVYCPIDGYWTAWSNYGECGVTCGEGYKYRTRECVGKKYDGKDCVGDYKEATDCKTDVYCPVDGYWTAWSNYGECGVTCGEGYKYRTRECVGKKYDGKDCVGDYKEATDCKTDVYCPVDGYWTAWSNYGECGVTCGEGYKYRTRKCVGKKYGGKDCVGDYKEATDCKTDVNCPINGYWSEWEKWSSCSKTCGDGIQTRTRTCNEPKYGGEKCEGSPKNTRKCVLKKDCVYKPVCICKKYKLEKFTCLKWNKDEIARLFKGYLNSI